MDAKTPQDSQAGPGHNSQAPKKDVSAQRLRSFIQRIERLEEEQKVLAADKSEVYSEAKATGFDPKIMRQVVKLRKMDAADREEQQSLLGVYLEAVGF